MRGSKNCLNGSSRKPATTGLFRKVRRRRILKIPQYPFELIVSRDWRTTIDARPIQRNPRVGFLPALRVRTGHETGGHRAGAGAPLPLISCGLQPYFHFFFFAGEASYAMGG